MQNPVPSLSSSAFPSAGRSEDERSETERSPADGKAGAEAAGAALSPPPPPPQPVISMAAISDDEMVLTAKQCDFAMAYPKK